MSVRVWPVFFVLAATFLVGCGKEEPDDGAKSGTAPVAKGPAPVAGGTLTDDAGKPRMSIPLVPSWDEYVAEHKAEHAGQELPEPRTRRDIYGDEKRLPALYLTHQSGARVIAPGDRRVHRDAATGQMCSPAMGCYNPDCPQRGEEPYGFLDTAESNLGRHCPACLALRNPDSETDADRIRWSRWVRPHELPETAARRRELMQERRQRIAWDRAHR